MQLVSFFLTYLILSYLAYLTLFAEYVINHAELPVVFCSANHISDLIKSSVNCPTLRVIVSFDPIDVPTKALLLEAATKTGVMIKDFRERESSFSSKCRR